MLIDDKQALNTYGKRSGRKNLGIEFDLTDTFLKKKRCICLSCRRQKHKGQKGSVARSARLPNK